MSRKNRTHLCGKRGQKFTDQIRDIPKSRILCVSIDIHKYFHIVMLHNALGEIVTPTFQVDIFRTGFEQLCRAIDKAIAQLNAQHVLIGMEPTGHYFENLARHLQELPRPVTLINSYAVKENRNQHMMQYEKNDDIDTASIGDLICRGEGSSFRPAREIYLQLQHLARAWFSKSKFHRSLKNQIIGHLDRVFPGLVLMDDKARKLYEPLFATNFWDCQTLQHLIRVCPDPRRLVAMSTQELIDAFHAQEYAMGPIHANKILAYTRKILLPDAELIAIRCELLSNDLLLLETIAAHMTKIEERLCALLQQTPYNIWVTVKGLSEHQVAMLAAAIGNPTHYFYAAQVFRRSGLVSGRNDSGTRQRKGSGNHIVKVGDVYLRRALMNAVYTLIPNQPLFRLYFHKLCSSKPNPVARVAVARRAIGILWAMQRDQYSRSLVLNKGVSDVIC